MKKWSHSWANPAPALNKEPHTTTEIRLIIFVPLKNCLTLSVSLLPRCSFFSGVYFSLFIQQISCKDTHSSRLRRTMRDIKTNHPPDCFVPVTAGPPCLQNPLYPCRQINCRCLWIPIRFIIADGAEIRPYGLFFLYYRTKFLKFTEKKVN